MIRGGADPDGRLAPTPQGEWARRLGALPPKRMVASWSGSSTDPTGYKDAAQVLPATAGSPRMLSECIDRSKPLSETEEVRRGDGLTNKSPYKRRPWGSLAGISRLSPPLGSIWPSTSFKFSRVDAVGAKGRSLWSPKRSGATSCWSSSLRCHPAWWGLRASGSAHHWARELIALGHEVRRAMPPAYVKPYIRRQKNDAADAAAIIRARRWAGLRCGLSCRQCARSMNQAALMRHQGAGDARRPAHAAAQWPARAS